MEENGDIYTVTMAKVYASQGHWEKAIEIYQHLLKDNPDRDDLVMALADLEKKKAGANGTAGATGRKFEDLAPLCREWIDLMLKHNRMQKLKKLKKRL